MSNLLLVEELVRDGGDTSSSATGGEQRNRVPVAAVAAVGGAGTPTRRVAAALGMRLGIGAAALLANCAPVARWPSPLPPRQPGIPEPVPAATFVAAYARGDEAEAERVASPLYAAEWARRGVSAPQRAALLPRWRRAAGGSAEWLRFAYVDGAADRLGFGHLLYAALPRAPREARSGGAIPTVWRVDTAPDGRVIWIEMVWLCSDGARRLDPVGAVLAADDVPLPGGPRARLLFGVRSGVGKEGYYAIGRQLEPEPTSPSGGPVSFLGVEPDGVARRGAWSYGQRGLAEYGAPLPPAAHGRLEAPYHDLRSDYLTAL